MFAAFNTLFVFEGDTCKAGKKIYAQLSTQLQKNISGAKRFSFILTLSRQIETPTLTPMMWVTQDHKTRLTQDHKPPLLLPTYVLRKHKSHAKEIKLKTLS